jgi:hypothetical protein
MITLPVISPYAPEAMGGMVPGGAIALTSVASATWPSANLLIGYPFRIFSPTLITKLWVANGATASGNLDLGIYDERGTKIVSSGSTAQSGANVLQAPDITDTWLGPGDYYCCCAMNGTTGTTLTTTWGHLSQGYALGQVQMVTAFPLPATATFVVAFNSQPLFGALVGPRTVI